MPLTALADILVAAGFVNAINLDGGGSTTLTAHDSCVHARCRLRAVFVTLLCVFVCSLRVVYVDGRSRTHGSVINNPTFDGCGGTAAGFHCERPVTTIG